MNSAFNRNFFAYSACAAFNWVVLVTKKNLRIAGLCASLLFLPYLCNKRLNHQYALFNYEEKSGTDRAGIE